MGRSMPSDDDPLIHPALSFSLLVAGMAATMSIISGLCLCGFGRKSSPDPSSPGVRSTEEAKATTATPATTEHGADTTIPLPPPTSMMELRDTCSSKYMPKSESTRKFGSTMSVKIPRSMSQARQQEEKLSKKKNIKLDTDDNSIWTKTIILGEKCRIRDDEDDVIFDRKDTQIHSTLQTSSSDPYVIPSQDNIQKGT
ncbi:hypothetical protein SLE2022_148230 [Rubroshorea leprosula]